MSWRDYVPVVLQKRKNKWILTEVFSTKKDLCCNVRLVIKEAASSTRLEILSTFTLFAHFVKRKNHTNLSHFRTYKKEILSVSLCKYFNVHRLSVEWDDDLKISSLLSGDRSRRYLEAFVVWWPLYSYVVKGKCIFEISRCFKKLLQCQQETSTTLARSNKRLLFLYS